MTNAEKVQYLSQYRAIDRQIERLLGERREWAARAASVSAACSGMPANRSGGDRVASCVERMLLVEEEIDEQVCRLVCLRRTIERYIETVPDERQRDLLRYRYIDGLTWERVADAMHYSTMQINRLHAKALTAMAL